MKLLLFLLFANSMNCNSQVNQNGIDYISYYNNIHEANYYFYEAEYDLAVSYFERGLKFVNEPRPKDYYNYCRALWKTGNYKFAEFELTHSPYILANKVFGLDSTFFHGMSIEIKTEIVANTVFNTNNYDDFHNKFIDSINIEDQKMRHRENEITDNEFYAKQATRDSLNEIAVLNYAKKYGFPAGVNNSWSQGFSTILLHFSREWFVENYHFLMEEVKVGNLEPWMLSRAIDRMFVVNESKATAPFNTYYGSDEPDPFLVFKNCATIGVSPYYDFDYFTGVGNNGENRRVFYDVYKANKKVYTLTLFQ